MEGTSEWLTELAWHEWHISHDDLWDTRGNVCEWRAGDGERAGYWEPPARLGITFPVLFVLLDAYADRRRRELREQGSVAAAAHHDPKALSALDDPIQASGPGPEPDWRVGLGLATE